MLKNALLTLDQAASLGNIEAYTHWANQVPMLTEAEEQALARRLYEEHDVEAARRLVLAHLRFVIRVARGYMGYGLPLADLIQEGNVGLMKAVKRFNPDVGVRLVSFAVHWIKAEIHEFILRNWRIVKIATTKAQRKLFFNLRSSKKRLGWLNQAEIEGVAADLGVPAYEVAEMESRLNAHDVAFDADPDQDDESSTMRLAPEHYLEDHRYNPAKQIENEDSNTQDQQQLHAALASLDARSRDILEKRWFAQDKATLHELAAEYQVSAERIRQLEKNAMDKLKALLVAN